MRIKERNDKGQVLGTETSYRLEEHSEVQFVHDPRFWRLVGYWIGDGTITKSKPGRIGYEVSWTFGLHEKEYGEDVLSILREVLNKAGTFQEVKNGDVVMTHRGHLGEVQALESHEYSGELIKLWVYGNAVDPITMTVDHKIRSGR